MDGAVRTEVRLLGGFGLRRGPAWLPVPGPSGRVVAVLGLRGRLGREAVASTLWPDTLPDRAQSYLRTALWRLNLAARGLVTTTGPFLELAPGVEVDARVLLAWATAALPSGGPVEGEVDAELVGRELLPSWDEPWLDEHRERLRVLVPEALEAAALTRLEAAAPARALWYALLAHQLDPLRESAVRILVQVHQSQGNHGAALDAARRYRALLRAELGIEPTAALTALVPHRLQAVHQGGPADAAKAVARIVS